MPRSNTAEGAGGRLAGLPLPQGWDLNTDFDGKVYFIDHNTQKTTWVDPRDSLTKPASFADCVGDELPLGWEQVLDLNRGVYYVNHSEKQVQEEDPRLEWRALQEEMLRQYLVTAQDDLVAKKDLVTVKQARLSLAQDEYNHLNTTLSAFSNSTTSREYSRSCSQTQTSSPNILLDGSYSFGDGHLHVGDGYYSPNPTGTCSAMCPSPAPYSPAPPQTCYSSAPVLCYSSPPITPVPHTANYLSHSQSNQSLNSTCSTSSSTKYDPDLLKSDVNHAKARVQRLRRELANINSEMDYKQKGVDTLHNVNSKLIESGQGLTLEEATAIRTELLNIQQSLSTGEQEKIELMKSLACLKDDLTRLQPSESSFDVSLMTAQERLSTASQTDLSGEMVPIGARLAELARLRLQYDEQRRSVQEIQQQLASLEDRISPGQLESDQDRLLLIQEKEQLMRELRSINSRNRSKTEMLEVKQEIRKLESDLNNAMEVSNKCIADRLKIHEEKQFLLQRLKDSMRSVSALESQLKLLSASTLSMSSSSSLGSLSSSHASSKGSLSSLSFTDIYGMSTIAQPDSSMLDLHRRVERILIGSQQQSGVQSSITDNNNQNSDIETNSGLSGSQSHLIGSSGQLAGALQLTPTSLSMPKLGPVSGSQLSLSPRSSLSSVSPPVSPYEPPCPALPPSYDQAYLNAVDKQKRLQAPLPISVSNQVETTPNGLEESMGELRLRQQPGTTLSPSRRLPAGRPGNFELGDIPGFSLAPNAGLSLLHRRSGQDSVGSDQSAPLSPISETTSASDDRKTLGSSSIARSVSAAVSDESVAGDSGVFEASHRKVDLGLDMYLETAQVQIKLRYSHTDDLLHVGIERARNLAALFIPEGRRVCIKAALLPAISNVMCTFCTRAISDLNKPTFGENFPIAIPKGHLSTKILQVNVWAMDMTNNKEDCLGSAQVSMADFKPTTTSVKWYNVLSFHFMQPEAMKKPPTASEVKGLHASQESEITVSSSRQGTLKEESSDESTIISSQTSTLTRNIGPESMMGHAEPGPEIVAQYLGQAEFCVDGGISFQVDDHDDSEEEVDEDEFLINENMDSFFFPVVPSSAVDAETNTECVFIQQPVVGSRKSSREEGGTQNSRLSSGGVQGVVKRSKTFSPSAPIQKSQYNCKLNRSDSDSAMPLYRRLPFQRSSKERRSLHVPSGGSSASVHMHGNHGSRPVEGSRSSSSKTSIDLELDLAAQQSKLRILGEEIERLRRIKEKMEEAKNNGDKELPLWLQEDEKFQSLLASLEEKTGQKSYEEKRMEKILRKTSKEIYKLRKTKSIKGQIDVHSFKEKMAFFTSVKVKVPILSGDDEKLEDEIGSENSTLHPADVRLIQLHSDTEGTQEEDVGSLKEGLSTETVNTITEECEQETEHSSQNSTPTPSAPELSIERFSYEIDPELGAFV